MEQHLAALFSVNYRDVPSVADRELARLPELVDLDSLGSVGRIVEMPDHSYDVDADVLGPLDPLVSVYPDFCVVVEGPVPELGPIAHAIGRASSRIIALTESGRELTTERDRELADEFDIYTPNYASDPVPHGAGVLLSTDWKGEMLPQAARACLAVVVQELLSVGVSEARIRRIESE